MSIITLLKNKLPFFSSYFTNKQNTRESLPAAGRRGDDNFFMDIYNFISLLGVIALLSFAWLFSEKRGKTPPIFLISTIR